MTPVEDLQRFTAPVDGVERQKVAVAFELAVVTADGRVGNGDVAIHLTYNPRRSRQYLIFCLHVFRKFGSQWD